MQKCAGEKESIPRDHDGDNGVQEMIPGTPPPPPSIVQTSSQSNEPPLGLVKQPSFHGARPRRSCLRRQSTATTVCSAGAGSAGGELSDELKAQLLVEPASEEGECPKRTVPAAVSQITRSVSFSEKANVQEYGMILGDHPCVDRGPPLTLSWEVQNAYSQEVVDRQNPRRGVQLRIPANLRTEVVSVTASQAEISKATFEVRKLRSQRHTTVALQELEGFQILWQSAVRKLQRWQRKKKLQRSASSVESSPKAAADAPPLEAPSPAEAWLEANTIRRGGKLVLKPGVPPYDPSTALTVGEESAEEDLPVSTACAVGCRPNPSSTFDAAPSANAECWALPAFERQESQSQHQRKASEDDSQETSPTVVSAVDDDASSSDEGNSHVVTSMDVPSKDGEILV